MIFQDVRSAVSHRLNVLEAVIEPLVVQGKKDREKMTGEVKKVLAEVELPTDKGFLYSYPHHLSGGASEGGYSQGTDSVPQADCCR